MRGRGIIDFRHGTTDVTGKAISGRLRGIHLNHAGQTQARQLVSRLDGWAIDRIVTSPLERAVETATPLAEARRLPIYQLDAVTELDFGHWTGRTLDELEQDPEWWNFVHHRAAALIPEGETLYQVQERMVRAMLQLHHAQTHASIALFSHGDPLKTLICRCCCIPLDCMLRFELETASISVVDVGDQHPVVRGVNMLAPAASTIAKEGVS